MVTTQKSAVYTDWALCSFFTHTSFTEGNQFILIDNDGGYELPNYCLHFPIEILINEQPQSFAANVNAMARRAVAQSADLYFLNNDVIFTKNWINNFLVPLDVVLVPISNREVQYTLPSNGADTAFSCPLRMDLNDYIGREDELDRIVAMHQQRMVDKSALLPVLCAPFFVVKIPVVVLRAVGAFDLRFGIGGGEDYDYCLRVHQLGFSVAYVQTSFLLHFGAKSISNESKGLTEPNFVKEFRMKWGESAYRLIFDDAPGIMEVLGLRSYNFQKRGFGELITQLVGDAPREYYLPL